MSEKQTRSLVLDTSVAVKFYLPEEGHEEAVKLLEAVEAGTVELLAPGTILPEGFNAIAQQQRRNLLDAEDARRTWEKLLGAPVYTYATEDLIERAAEIARKTGVIVYDALFLALAKDAEAKIISADGKLLNALNALKDTQYASLAIPLAQVDNLLR